MSRQISDLCRQPLWLCLLISHLFFTFSSQAKAFERCNELDDGAELRYQKRGIEISPVDSIEISAGIRISLAAGQAAFFPYSAKVGQDRFIVFPRNFLTAACQIVVADGLPKSANVTRIQERFYLDAAQCLDLGKTPNVCLSQLGQGLAKKLVSVFASLQDNRQSHLLESYVEVIDFVLAHELAHHLLGHFETPTLTQNPLLHLERDADMAALVMQGQAFNFSGPAIHLFGPIASVELKMKELQNASHGSSICRRLTAERFELLLGNENITNNLAEISARLHVINNSKPDKLVCGDSRQEMLMEYRQELLNLYENNIPSQRLLSRSKSKFNTLIARKIFEENAKRLKSANFVYAIAGAILRETAEDWLDHKQYLDELSDLLDDVLSDQLSSGRLRNSDYGSLLEYRARIIKFDTRSDPSKQKFQKMLSLLRTATIHSPYDTTVWAWMAMTSLSLADCKNALRYAEQSLKTLDPKLNDNAAQSIVSDFVHNIRPLASDRSKCIAKANFEN